MFTVDIDVGGTLTDGLFSDGARAVSVKVDTTPHDLTVCLSDCLTQGAAQLGFDELRDFLENVGLIRWSTTITSNVLAELRGPRLGLILSRGHEADLYGSEVRSLLLGRLVSEQNVIGIETSTSETDIMNAARSLLESGVRRICISLKDGDRHPEQELRIKRIIDQQYPDHFLGSVPVLAGSDISQGADAMTRTCCALLNAYTHGALAATLFKAEDELRETFRYAGAFLVSHINGGVAGISKTRAIDTFESGPILGIHGSSHMAKAYGLNHVVAMDVGGTTAKIGILRDAAPLHRRPSDFFGIPVSLSLPYLRSIALGGGSVVRVRSSGPAPELQLGPESMGSYPGPACYGLGGDQPTLTDAFVTAGLINPDFFLGGTKPIDRDLARKTIENQVARPMHLSTEAACRAILARAFEIVASVITAAATELRQDLAQHALFAYGGNGGLFACGVAQKAGLHRVQLFALGSVFSAFGSSVSDICHVYERIAPGAALSDGGLLRLRQLVEEMKAEGIKDLLGEGIRPDDVGYAIEFEVSENSQHSVPVPCAESSLQSMQELQWTLAAAGITGGVQSGDVSVELIRVRVQKPVPKPQLTGRSLQAPASSHARTGTRRIAWGSDDGEAQVYRWESLQPGNAVAGPALLEGLSTTYFLPQGWQMAVDQFGNGAVGRQSGKS